MRPDRLRILGIDYAIQFTDLDVLGSNNAGACHSTRCLISVCTHVNSLAHQKSVLLHEIIEALDYRLELKLDHNVLTSLEAGLFSVFQDNPELLDYLND